MNVYRWCLTAVLICTSSLLINCGGSTSSGSSTGSTDVPGLEVASQVSLVEAQDVETSPALSREKSFSKAAQTLKAITSDQTTPYYTDPLHVFVYDDSMKALNIINEILCAMDQTQYASMVNQGNYIALVNATRCNQSSDKSSENSNQSSSSNAANFEEWTVNTTRADTDAPQYVDFWFTETAESEHDVDRQISGRVTITEAASDDNPFGLFHMDFMMSHATEGTTLAQGYLEAIESSEEGMVEFQFSMTGQEGFDMNEAVHLVTNVDGTSGYAFASYEESFGNETHSGEFNIAFNSTHYLANDGTSNECLDRENFNNRVFRYGVYKEDGSRLEMDNPGFGIKYVDDTNDQTYFGWADYYGMWFPEEVSLVSDMTVLRANNDSDEETSYTTFVAPGRLIKHTMSEITLADIKDENLKYFDDSTGGHKVIQWNGTAFKITGTEAFGDNGPTITQLDTPEDFNIEAGRWYGFWKDGIGSVNMVAPNNPDDMDDSFAVTIETMVNVNPSDSAFSDGELTLYCYTNCLKSNMTQAMLSWEQGATPHLDEAADVNTPYIYTIDPENMTLKRNTESIVMADGESAAEGANSWGIHSGAMLISTDGLTNIWDTWGQDEFYTWETGPNNWNQYRMLLNAGTPVTFDRPVHFMYTHEATGSKYNLDYAGFGELHGLPWVDGGNDRWYPEITIPDGSVITSESTNYYVRALEMEQVMQSIDESDCSSLELQSLTTPDTEYTEPDIGDKPTVTDDPAVIDGVLTSSSS